MKVKIIVLVTFLPIIALLGFKNSNEIDKCFISFTTAPNLSAGAAERLPETAEKFRKVVTDEGEVEITRIDGYRVLYKNDKMAAFVNMKVELSAHNAYETDKKRLIDNLKYLIAHSPDMETKELIERNYNGYKISGLSRSNIDSGSILGIFIMHPGNGVTVYFYFNNLKPELRHYESLDEYKKQRDKFFEEYTKHLKTCSEGK